MNPLIVDNTWAEHFRKCFAMGNYRMNKHLTTETTAPPLIFGRAIHGGLAGLYQGYSREQCCALAVRRWAPTPDIEDNWRTPDKVLEVLDQYLNWPHNSFDLLLGRDGKPIVESFGVYPILTLSDSISLRDKLENCGYSDLLFGGIVDLMAVWDGRNAIVDHKTTTSIYTPRGEPSNIKLDFWEQFKLSKQLRGYIWLASQFLTTPIYTAIINALGVSKANDRNCFERREFTFTPSEVEEWRQDTLALVEQVLDCKIKGFWPTNGAPYYCHAYNSVCAYKGICCVPPERRSDKEALFVVNPWNFQEARDREAVEFFS